MVSVFHLVLLQQEAGQGRNVQEFLTWILDFEEVDCGNGFERWHDIYSSFSFLRASALKQLQRLAPTHTWGFIVSTSSTPVLSSLSIIALFILLSVIYFLFLPWKHFCHKFALLLILFSCVILHSNPCVFFRVQPLPFCSALPHRLHPQPLPFCSALPHRLHPQTHLFSIFSLVPSSISACQFPLPSSRSFVFLPDLPALLLVPVACLTSPCDLPAWSLDLSIAYSLSDIVRYYWPPGSWPRLCFLDILLAYSLLVLFAVDRLPGIELCSVNKPILCRLCFCVVHLGSRLPFCQPWHLWLKSCCF